MASRQTETALRIADGAVVVALAVISLASLWWLAPNPWIGIPQGVLAIMLIVLGVAVLVGKTRYGRLVRTRQRWKYLTGVGLVALLLGLMIASVVGSPGQLESNPVAGLLPGLMALVIAQFYEAESAAQSRTRSV